MKINEQKKKKNYYIYQNIHENPIELGAASTRRLPGAGVQRPGASSMKGLDSSYGNLQRAIYKGGGG